MAARNPLTVEVTRGGMVESRHRGAAVVIDAKGKAVHAWGEIERTVYPRSAIKPLQALALVETGAAEAFAVTDAELALASASHVGQPQHTEAILAWLERIGLGADDLECGAHEPLDPETAKARARAGESPGAADNNCSGKHVGMLTTAIHLGEETAGYTRPGHPVQQRLRAILTDMGGADLSQADLNGADLDGANVETVTTDAISPCAIALDVPGGKMYWTAGHPQSTAIWRANLDGTLVEGLVDSVRNFHRIAVDPLAAKMYWTTNLCDIQRANLDGSQIEQVLVDFLGTVDLLKGQSHGRVCLELHPQWILPLLRCIGHR
ncbi:MAG: asparaginase [Proteobacteria bacterium]|nr:asparaginase [Pseudomonadota bacterium]